MKKINLSEKFDLFNEHWTPKIIGETNGQLIKIAKVMGDFVWHSHANEDEVFLVIKGRLILQMRDGDVVLEPGEMYVVPRGVEHCPKADEETHILLIEPAATAHTGKTDSDLTVPADEQEWL